MKDRKSGPVGQYAFRVVNVAHHPQTGMYNCCDLATSDKYTRYMLYIHKYEMYAFRKKCRRFGWEFVPAGGRRILKECKMPKLNTRLLNITSPLEGKNLCYRPHTQLSKVYNNIILVPPPSKTG